MAVIQPCESCGATESPNAGACPRCGATAGTGAPAIAETHRSRRIRRESSVVLVEIGDGSMVMPPDTDVTLGRNSACPLSSEFARYPNVSRSHAIVRFERGALTVRDISGKPDPTGKAEKGVFEAGHRVDGHQVCALPVRLRFSSNCFVDFTVIPAGEGSAGQGTPGEGVPGTAQA